MYGYECFNLIINNAFLKMDICRNECMNNEWKCIEIESFEFEAQGRGLNLKYLPLLFVFFRNFFCNKVRSRYINVDNVFFFFLIAQKLILK